MMDNLIKNLGGRKLIITTASVMLGAVLVYLKGDIPPNFLTLLQVAIGAFVGGNVANQIGAFLAKRPEAVPSPQPIGVPVADAVAAFQTLQAQVDANRLAVEAQKATNEEILKSVQISQKALSMLLERRN
jgi:hypothetical protein